MKGLIILKIGRYIIKKTYCGRLIFLVIMTHYECEGREQYELWGPQDCEL